MGWLLSDEEREALWREEEKPAGVWESAEVRAERYEKALRGILACAGDSPAVWMLQAVAARALGDQSLEAYYTKLVKKSERI